NTVTVPAAALANNVSVSDLVQDVNDALGNATGSGGTVDLRGLVTAKPAVVDAATGAARVTFEGNRQSALKVERTVPAGNALGLLASVSATSLAGRMEAQSAGNKLILSAVTSFVRSGTTPPAFVLGQNASFNVSVTTAAGSQNKTVTVP